MLSPPLPPNIPLVCSQSCSDTRRVRREGCTPNPAKFIIHNMERIILFLVITSNIFTSSASRVQNIYWNTTTASQSPDPKVVLVNEGNLPWEYDQVNIICPVYKAGTPDPEQHVIYSVTKEEFQACRQGYALQSSESNIIQMSNQRLSMPAEALSSSSQASTSILAELWVVAALALLSSLPT